MRLRLIAIGLAFALLGAADYAAAAPFDDLDVGDKITVEILLSPKAFRVTEQGPFIPPDTMADFVTYCVDTQAPIQNGTFVVTGFGTDIDPRTAFLYTQYRLGLLPPGYDDPLPPPPGTSLSPKRPDGLQDAIDFIEGLPGEGVNNNLVALANCAVFGTGPGCAGPTWSGLGNVRSLKIRFDNDPIKGNTAAQDLLVRLTTEDICLINPTLPICRPPGNEVPEPGSMVLLGSGLFGLATSIRRRFRRRD
jgi:hypothetical protein